ncbi:MAG TPA: amidohydrolase [Firmicutes bacterium]|nr:amidohydrolase [Bacillota bacterium]
MQLKQQLIEIRRRIHQHPELGFEEFETAKLIEETLRKYGIETKRLAKTGVVGLLRGNGERTIALRADMDALPIQELNQVEYASKIPGKMHACGHDVHVTCLLGAAIVLSNRRNALRGNVKFIFQPAEEAPGGAKPMIEEGVLEDPKVDVIVGGHCWPGLPAGCIEVGEGPVMAAPDVLTLKIIGKGGHGAMPHTTVDAIAVAFQVGVALQQVVSRMSDPLDPVVLTIGSISGGTAPNVIAQEVLMKGSIRSLSPETHEKLPRIIEQVVKGVTSAYGATYEMDYYNLYPPTINDPKVAQMVLKAAEKALGPGKALWSRYPSMGGEDFSYFTQKIPGAFFRIGVSDPSKQRPSYPLHSPNFDVCEDAIPAAVSVLVQIVEDYLNQ